MSDVYLKLYDYLFGNCPYIGCIYNDGNLCTCSKTDHLQNIIEHVESSLNEETSTLKNKDITCYSIKVTEGHCECGTELVRYVDNVPYGSTTAELESWECPLCGE